MKEVIDYFFTSLKEREWGGKEERKRERETVRSCQIKKKVRSHSSEFCCRKHSFKCVKCFGGFSAHGEVNVFHGVCLSVLCMFECISCIFLWKWSLVWQVLLPLMSRMNSSMHSKFFPASLLLIFPCVSFILTIAHVHRQCSQTQSSLCLWTP